MAITRTRKEETVAKLEDIAKSAKTIVFVHFKDITANEVNAMRSAFVAEGVGYTVARKTLIKRAFDGASFTGDFPSLEGEIAIAYGDDTITPARAIAKAAKTIGGDRIVIVGGIFDGAYAQQEFMQEIANIPDLHTLHAQFVTVINAPIQGFVSALSQIAEKKA